MLTRIKPTHLCAVCVTAALMLSNYSNICLSQAVSVENTKAQTQQTLVDNQKKLVREIYESTKTVKTAKELSAFIEKCESALKQDLSAPNTKYVTSLTGWALNRRGNKRLELAEQLKSIGNSQHTKVMQQAMDDFNSAVTKDPDRYRSWMSRGIAFMSQKDYRRAALDFTSVIKLKTDLANGWFNRAEALYELGQYKQAASDYNVVLNMNSDDAQALTGRGHSNFAIGKTESALKDYQRVVELVPENAIGYINVGDAMQKLGRWPEATDCYEKSLTLKESAAACQRTAWLKATCPDQNFRDAADAVTKAKRAIELAGDSAVNLDTLAAAEAAKGNFDAAKSTQQKVIGLASATEEINDSEQQVYQARLALYEKGEAYTDSKESDQK